jgi:hypothetical protein
MTGPKRRPRSPRPETPWPEHFTGDGKWSAFLDGKKWTYAFSMSLMQTQVGWGEDDREKVLAGLNALNDDYRAGGAVTRLILDLYGSDSEDRP